MKITKGTKVKVNDKRKGIFYARANSNFDTKDEWYDLILEQDYLEGMSNDWVRGERVPARKGISYIEIIEADKEE
jgi:hypothetical protein